MAIPSLTIVILSYNVEKLLVDCLNSLFKSKTSSDLWNIIVIDNASSDNSVQAVRKFFPDIKIIKNKTNLGFSAGNNIALHQVKTDFVLLLNPDTVVYPGAIQTVQKYLEEHPDVAAATCRVELPDGTLDYSCHRRFPNPWNSFMYLFTGLGKKSSYAFSQIPDSIHEIDALCGAFAMFRTDVGKKLGWFDEDYFWNGEDLDFCYRIKKASYKVVFIPEVKITHFKGSSSGLQKSAALKVDPATKTKMALSGVGAMRIFYDKHYASSYPKPFNWLVYLGMWLLKTYRTLKIKVLQNI
jgi:GT2 family glycosyltransferase